MTIGIEFYTTVQSQKAVSAYFSQQTASAYINKKAVSAHL